MKTLLAVISRTKNNNEKGNPVGGMLLAMAHTAFAEQREAFMEFHRKNIPEKKMEANPALMPLPIEVIYDSDTHKIEVIGDDSTEAEVHLYNANGTLEEHSSSLNTNFMVLAPGTYIIQIQGNGWHAEGEIEV